MKGFLSAVFWVLIIVGLIIGSCEKSELKSESRPFQTSLSEYTQIPTNVVLLLAPTRVGKLLIIERHGVDIFRNDPSTKSLQPKVSPHWKDLPPHLKATRPEEVGTIALIEMERVEVGSYGTQRAYSIVRHLTLIDQHSRTVTYSRSFRGSPPPDSRRRNSVNPMSNYGTDPIGEVVMCIRKMKEKTSISAADQTISIDIETEQRDDKSPEPGGVPNANTRR